MTLYDIRVFGVVEGLLKAVEGVLFVYTVGVFVIDITTSTLW